MLSFLDYSQVCAAALVVIALGTFLVWRRRRLQKIRAIELSSMRNQVILATQLRQAVVSFLQAYHWNVDPSKEHASNLFDRSSKAHGQL